MAASDPTTPDPILNDPEFAELVDYFRGELPERVRALESCASQGDLAGLQRLAHQLKGAAPGFGFPRVGEAARRLEDRLRHPEDVQPGLDQIRAELDALIVLCRSYFHDAGRAA